VRAHRLALVQDAADRDSLREAAEAQLTRPIKWPKRGLDVLKHALAQPGSTDLATSELALRTLCVRAEILTDSPTPSADQTLRREYQVKRLMQSMGQGIKSEEGLDALTLEWLAVGPIEEGTYLQLLERFKSCRGKAL
jgi:predicted PP-loop superfamily ATPase